MRSKGSEEALNAYVGCDLFVQGMLAVVVKVLMVLIAFVGRPPSRSVTASYVASAVLASSLVSMRYLLRALPHQTV